MAAPLPRCRPRRNPLIGPPSGIEKSRKSHLYAREVDEVDALASFRMFTMFTVVSMETGVANFAKAGTHKQDSHFG
jgi:hypothetical protein